MFFLCGSRKSSGRYYQYSTDFGNAVERASKPWMKMGPRLQPRLGFRLASQNNWHTSVIYFHMKDHPDKCAMPLPRSCKLHLVTGTWSALAN